MNDGGARHGVRLDQLGSGLVALDVPGPAGGWGGWGWLGVAAGVVGGSRRWLGAVGNSYAMIPLLSSAKMHI